jgi:hypothetical protein
MPSTFDRAVAVTRRSLPLAAIPAAATLLSGSKVARTLAAGPGGGVTFPFPTGLPTLWTYVSVPGTIGSGSVGGPLSVAVFVPLFLFGLLVTSALEAGFLGSLDGRIDGESVTFPEAVRRYTLRIVGVNLLRAAIVLLVLPLVVLPPLAIVVVLALSYLVYGLPFEIVVRDAAFRPALEATVSHALAGGPYATFGVAHLVAGAVASVALTALVRNGGPPGLVVGTALIAVPAVFVAAYGLLVFRDLSDDREPTRAPV